MTGKFLVRSKGALQLVESLDGYPRAPVVAENVPDPPHADAILDEAGHWVDPPSPPLSLEERIAALEGRVNAG